MSDPVKQRAALEKTLSAAWEQYSQSTIARQAAEVELEAAKRAADAVRRARPAGQATDKDALVAEHRMDTAQENYDRYYARTNQALDAANGLERERDLLLKSNLAVYAEQAEAATQAAAQALTQLVAVLRGSQEAWRAACAEWAPLARVAGVAGVAAWPLPDADALLADVQSGAVVARPPQVMIAG